MEEELAKAFENSNYESTYSGGQMEWPIPGEYYITSYVGWRWGRMHKGIDILSLIHISEPTRPY